MTLLFGIRVQRKAQKQNCVFKPPSSSEQTDQISPVLTQFISIANNSYMLRGNTTMCYYIFMKQLYNFCNIQYITNQTYPILIP
jgi:hypothetical protein